MDKKRVNIETKNIIFIITYSIVLAVALFNMNTTMSLLGWIIAILNPFLTGLVVAFIINIIMKYLENKAFRFLDKPKFKLWQKLKRPVCMLLSFLIILLAIAAVVLFVGPQLAQSIRLLSGNMPIYVSYLQNMTSTALGWFNLGVEDLGSFAISWNDIFNRVSSILADISPRVLNFATGFTSSLFNFFMGVIFAIYLLLGKEKLLYNVEITSKAVLSPKNFSNAKSIRERLFYSNGAKMRTKFRTHHSRRVSFASLSSISSETEAVFKNSSFILITVSDPYIHTASSK